MAVTPNTHDLVRLRLVARETNRSHAAAVNATADAFETHERATEAEAAAVRHCIQRGAPYGVGYFAGVWQP